MLFLIEDMRKILLLLILVQFQLTDAQEVLTLDDALRITLDNNIDIKRSKNNALIAQSDKAVALVNYLPSVNARWNYNMLFGTFWDNIAAKQVTEQYSSNPNVNANMTLFNGFSNHYDRKRADLSLMAAQEDVESSTLDAKANVMSAYLSVMLDKENVKISEERLKLLEAQLDREIKRESVGVGNMETVYNFRSQVANEKLNYVNLQNQLKSDVLQLVQVLQLDVTKEYDVESYDGSEEELMVEPAPYAEIFETTLNYSPMLKRAQYNHESSLYSFKQARSQLVPTVNLYGELGSRYSSQGAANPNNDLIGEKAPYLTQMDWNQYQFAQISVNIPIFTGLRTRNSIQTARLGMQNAELDRVQAEQTVTNTIQRVYLDLIAAQESYRTAQENMTSLEQSYNFVKKRYETGNTDFFTFLESLNNKNAAELQLVNAKYSIVFRKKILEIYQGK